MSKAAKFNELTLLYLMNTHCKQFLTYGLKILTPPNSSFRSLDYAYNLALKRILKIDWQEIDYIKDQLNLSSISQCIQTERLKFLNKCGITDSPVIQFCRLIACSAS